MSRQRSWLAALAPWRRVIVDRWSSGYPAGGQTTKRSPPSFPVTNSWRPTLPRTTRALTIDAPVEMVWPWLVQIGEDRGGFYSYSWLERAAGHDIHNAEHDSPRVAEHPRWRHGMAGAPIRRPGSAGGGGGQGQIALGADVT